MARWNSAGQWSGGGREVSEQQAETILHAVLDAGINFIDTPPDYGFSEQRIGRYINTRRDEYYLATKCGCDPHDVGDHWETPHTWTRDRILCNIEQSLQDMRTDYVDVLQLHNPREEAKWDEIIAALQEVRDQGLTRFIGVSHTLPWLDKCIETGVFDTYQIPYSCCEPRHHDAITRAGEAGGGIIIRGGIAKGGPESEVGAGERLDVWAEADLDEFTKNMSPAELILRHTLTHPHCHTTIVGTLNPEHLEENLQAAAKGPLPQDLYDEIQRRVGDVAGA